MLKKSPNVDVIERQLNSNIKSMMRNLLAIALILLNTGTMVSAEKKELIWLSGTAIVTDGDTIKIGKTTIRIHGIDAPEKNQECKKKNLSWPCGAEATRLMRTLVKQLKVKCEAIDTDRYGRIVGRCFSGDNDLGRSMVTEGLALAYRRYSNDYVSMEAIAKSSTRGMWAGEFIQPWDWRRGKRLEQGQGIKAINCLIKGNISRSGERIYHLPGGRYYAQTKINTAKSERYFCTEKEALKAGWRKARW